MPVLRSRLADACAEFHDSIPAELMNTGSDEHFPTSWVLLGYLLLVLDAERHFDTPRAPIQPPSRQRRPDWPTRPTRPDGTRQPAQPIGRRPEVRRHRKHRHHRHRQDTGGPVTPISS
jgi:hypothetical protein